MPAIKWKRSKSVPKLTRMSVYCRTRRRPLMQHIKHTSDGYECGVLSISKCNKFWAIWHTKTKMVLNRGIGYRTYGQAKTYANGILSDPVMTRELVYLDNGFTNPMYCDSKLYRYATVNAPDWRGNIRSMDTNMKNYLDSAVEYVV